MEQAGFFQSATNTILIDHRHIKVRQVGQLGKATMQMKSDDRRIELRWAKPKKGTCLSYRWDKKVSTPFINISVNGESVTEQTANGWVFDKNLTHWCLLHNGIWPLHWDKQHLTDFSESVKSHDYVSRAVRITDTNPEILTRLHMQTLTRYEMARSFL